MDIIVFVAAGTRPEVLKLAPVVRELQRRKISHHVHVTSQHTTLLDQALADAPLVPHSRGSVRAFSARNMSQMLGKLLDESDGILSSLQPNIAIIQGDNYQHWQSLRPLFLRGIPLVHVEAGLRTHNLMLPFPEEANRRQISQLLLCMPLRPNWPRRTFSARVYGSRTYWFRETPSSINWNTLFHDAMYSYLSQFATHALLTAHRRESWGRPMEEIARSLPSFSEHQNCSLATRSTPWSERPSVSCPLIRAFIRHYQ